MPKRSGRPARRPLRPALPTVLLACEGMATEPHYLAAVCQAAGFAAATILPVGAGPLAVVTQAARRRADFDEVWCLFDCDRHADLRSGLELAARRGFSTAVSNPCFELWLLLHFEYTTAPLTAAEATARLLRHLPGYAKERRFFNHLWPRTRDAIRRAAQLRAAHLDAGDPPTHNPSTNVDGLVERLLFLSAAGRPGADG